MSARLVMGLGALAFAFINVVSGIGYTILKFDVLGHSSGTGVIPGPWLVVPFLSLPVIPAGVVVGVMLHAVTTWSGRKSDPILWIMGGYIACSLLFHGLVATTIILDAPFWDVS